MNRLLQGFVAGLAFAVAGASLAVYLLWDSVGREAYYEWPVVQFAPACGIHEEYPDTEPSRLTFVDGAPSEEFWRVLSGEPGRFSWFLLRDESAIRVNSNRLFLPYAEFHRSPVTGKGLDGQREFWFHWVASTIAAEMLEKRKAEGRFTDADQKDFMVFRKRWNMHKPMEPGECGFMEELIMKGGRFAAE